MLKMQDYFFQGQPAALAELTECCLLEIFRGPAKKQIKLKSIEMAISLTMEYP